MAGWRARFRTFRQAGKRGIEAARHEAHLSYSQCGEDIILDFLFRLLRVGNPMYLDLGAHHPVYLSNTFLFYNKGSVGVCVEADPALCERIREVRPRDQCLNMGVGISAETEADFYILSSPTLNTFSKEEAEKVSGYGQHKIVRVVKIPMININDIMARYFERTPDLVSIDIEGLDLIVLKSIDFKRFRPLVFCIETLTYTEDASEQKLTETIEYLESHGYRVYADTYINTIFVDRQALENREK